GACLFCPIRCRAYFFPGTLAGRGGDSFKLGIRVAAFSFSGGEPPYAPLDRFHDATRRGTSALRAYVLCPWTARAGDFFLKAGGVGELAFSGGGRLGGRDRWIESWPDPHRRAKDPRGVSCQLSRFGVVGFRIYHDLLALAGQNRTTLGGAWRFGERHL